MVLWLKAVHVIAVIAWMAGLFYLPRLFVYHCQAEPGSQTSQTFKVMEHRLLRYIMNPAMLVVWVTGPWLAWVQGMFYDRWLWADIDADPDRHTLADEAAGSQELAMAAVAAWVTRAQAAERELELDLVRLGSDAG